MKKSVIWTFVLSTLVLCIALGQGEHSTLSHSDALPAVPAVNTDMACPTIVDGWPDMIGSTDASSLTCFAAPVSSSPLVVGSPNSRSVSLATAYQATDTAHAALVAINLTSTASISLSGGTTNSATVVIGSTNGVAGGTGTVICNYSNSNTGALTIGLNLSTVSAVPCSFVLPAGWYFAARQTAGTVTITSVFDQSMN